MNIPICRSFKFIFQFNLWKYREHLTIVKICLLLAAFQWVLAIKSQGQVSVVASEYFFDVDPGVGNGNPLSVGISGAEVTFSAQISTAALSPGFHGLNIRVLDDEGNWGHFESHTFYLTPNIANHADIVAAEYFIDDDPGVGSGIAINVGAVGPVSNFTATIPTTGLSQGFHKIMIRAQDSNGNWGLFESHTFYLTSNTANQADIVAAEYFIDDDPGVGSGIAINVGASGPVSNFTATIPTTGLSQGFHKLLIRVQDSNGNWGLYESHTFYLHESSTSIAVGAEIFTGNDPGVGNGFQVEFTAPGATVTELVTARISPCLPEGTNNYKIRVKDNNGVYGLFELGDITIDNSTLPEPLILAVVQDDSICTGQDLSLSAAGYAIDQATSYTWNGPNGFTSSEAAPVIPDLIQENSGTYTLSITYNPGCVLTTSIEVEVNLSPTVGLSISPNPICEGETLFLNASGGDFYSWTGPDSFFSSIQNLVITDISPEASGMYSVKVTSVAGCSTIAENNVQVNSNPVPLISSTPNPVCILENLDLAVSGTGSFNWTGPNGFNSDLQSIVIPINGAEQAGIYAVTVTSPGGCLQIKDTLIGVMNCADEINSAITIIPGSDCASNKATIELAGNTLGEPIPPCGADYENFATVWFKFNPPASGNVRIKTQSDVGGLDGTKIGVYKLNGNPQYENLELIACEDAQFLPKLSEFYLTNLDPLITYYIQIGSDNPDLISGKVFCVSLDELTADMFSNSDCESDNPEVSCGNSVKNFWLSLTDSQGKLIANVLHNGNASIGKYYADQYINTGPVRQDAQGIYYLDRNWTVKSDAPPGEITISTFLTESEFDKIAIEDNSIDDISDLIITHVPNQECASFPSGSDNILVIPEAQSVGNGYCLTFLTDGFSSFYAHGGDIPLPLRLIKFTAKENGLINVIEWKTEAESSIERYLIERNLDLSMPWQTIGSVTANNSYKNLYSYSDKDPGEISYYRLKTIGIGGHSSYSEIASVKRQNFDDYEVFPSVSNSVIYISGHIKKSINSQAIIYNQLGIPQMSWRIDIRNETMPLDINLLPIGFYILDISDNGQKVQSFKIIRSP